MASTDNIAQLPRRKSNSVILPPLKLEFLISSININIDPTQCYMRIITPHTPPGENPHEILRDKLTKSISEKMFGINAEPM